MGVEPVVRLVGAGPGEPDLLTLDAEAAVARARVLVADRSLALLVADLGPARAAEPVWVDDDLPAVDELLAAAAAGPGVVRLYRGDPWFHPAGDAERSALHAAGATFDTVPGVVAELALLAAAGIPAQVRTLAVTTTFVVDDPIRPAGESPSPGLVSVGTTEVARSAGRSAGPGPASVGRTALVPLDAAHALVVRTTDLAATARSLATLAHEGVAPGRAAAAVPTADPSQVVRSTLGALADLAPPGPGVVVVGLVAALDVGAPAPTPTAVGARP